MKSCPGVGSAGESLSNSDHINSLSKRLVATSSDNDSIGAAVGEVMDLDWVGHGPWQRRLVSL